MNNKDKKKYSKILYFPKNNNNRIYDIGIKTAEQTSEKNKTRKIDKHYPFNCISKYYPVAHSLPYKVQMKFQLPCGFLYGESWGALRKCWKGYKLAKWGDDLTLMKEYATRIQTIQTQLGIPTASFPNLGLLGDIFFLYNKEDEASLRRKYAFENVVCDRFDVDNVEELVAEGKAIEFNNKLELKRYREREYYSDMQKVFMEWAESEKTQEYLKASQRRWNHRSKLRKELDEIKNELAEIDKVKQRLKKEGDKKYARFKNKDKRNLRRKELLQQKILKESELRSANAVQMVKTDTGWKYCREIIKEDFRKYRQLESYTHVEIKYDYEPRYYLTDLAGRRLADYKEEKLMGDKINDPTFYRLYLEDKEWEKIYSKESI